MKRTLISYIRKSTYKELITPTNEINDTWKHYFHYLLNKGYNHPTNTKSFATADISKEKPTLDDVKGAIYKLKK